MNVTEQDAYLEGAIALEDRVRQLRGIAFTDDLDGEPYKERADYLAACAVILRTLSLVKA